MKPKRKHAVPNWRKGKSAPYEWVLAHVGHQSDECLKWPFAHARGRGHFRHQGRNQYAARVICQIAHGDPPSPAHEAAHSCGKGHEGCVNPRHLSWKTRAENRRDCKQHGTNYRGNGNASAGKLTYEQAVEIRTRRGIDTADILAVRYNVSPTAIYLVWKGQTFKSPDQGRFHAWTPQEDERLRVAIARCMNKHETAKFVGRSKERVWSRARDLGIFQPPLKRGLPPGHVRRI